MSGLKRQLLEQSPAAPLADLYRAAREQAVLFDHGDWGRLRLTGRDRLDFLQRMGTNDLAGLSSGQGRATVLTNPLGRMVDRLVVYAGADDLLAVTSPGAAGLVRSWLAQHIFFMDQVAVAEVSADTGLLRIVGPRSAAVLADTLDLPALPEEPHAWVPALQAGDLRVARGDRLGANTFAVLGAGSALDDVRAALLGAGVASAAGDLYETLRIEAGLPAYGREIGEEYIPLEANLLSDISFTKGCYVGQEIIGRMESRGKQARALAGLRAAAPLIAGGDVVCDGQTIGRVSSAVVSPAHGPIALAFIRLAHAELATPVQVVSGGSVVAAEVAALPFET